MTSTTLRRVRLVTVESTDTVKGAPTMHGPEDVARVARAVLPTDREGFAVLHLDSRHRVRSVELASVGSLNASIVHPREVFKAAILANAAAIIITHNHPSGETDPSNEDLTITERLVKAGELLGISVLDHVIVTAAAATSLRERGEL